MKDIKINDAAYFPRPQAIYKALPTEVAAFRRCKKAAQQQKKKLLLFLYFFLFFVLTKNKIECIL